MKSQTFWKRNPLWIKEYFLFKNIYTNQKQSLSFNVQTNNKSPQNNQPNKLLTNELL